MCFTLSIVLVLGSVFSSSLFINVALANKMPDAPVTQDTINAGPAGDDSEGEGDIDEADSLPKPEDAPVTTEAITIGRPPEDDDASRQDNNDVQKDNGRNGVEAANRGGAKQFQCPPGQEQYLFSSTCKSIEVIGEGAVPTRPPECSESDSLSSGKAAAAAACGGSAAAAAACGGSAAAAAAAAANCGGAAAAAAAR
jgi:hypothetical protein